MVQGDLDERVQLVPLAPPMRAESAARLGLGPFCCPNKAPCGETLSTPAHASGTSSFRGEGQPKVVSEMLGHREFSTTLDVYSHVSLELQQQAAAKLDAALTGRR